MDESVQKRYKNSLDTLSLLDDDGVALSAEEIASAHIGFMDVLAHLTTDRQRFIALALYQGWNKVEISKILKVDPSDIGHITRTMQVKLAIYHIRYKLR